MGRKRDAGRESRAREEAMKIQGRPQSEILTGNDGPNER
jgi:hypothetical protein